MTGEQHGSGAKPLARYQARSDSLDGDMIYVAQGGEVYLTEYEQYEFPDNGSPDDGSFSRELNNRRLRGRPKQGGSEAFRYSMSVHDAKTSRTYHFTIGSMDIGDVWMADITGSKTLKPGETAEMSIFWGTEQTSPVEGRIVRWSSTGPITIVRDTDLGCTIRAGQEGKAKLSAELLVGPHHGQVVTAEITVRSDDPPVYTHILEYDANGGDPETLPSNRVYTGPDASAGFAVSETEPSRAGYAFAGWSLYTDGHGTRYFKYDVIRVQGTTVLYAIWETPPVEKVTLVSDSGEYRAIQGTSPAFTATVQPADASKNIVFEIVTGKDLATVKSQSQTAEGMRCTVDVSTSRTGVFVLRATSAEYPEIYSEVAVKVDTQPTVYGSPEMPLDEPVTMALEDCLGDTFYVTDDNNVWLSATDTADVRVTAESIAPADPSMIIDGTGAVYGSPPLAPGTYVATVTYRSSLIEAIEYTVTITVVEPVDIPATAVKVEGPASLPEGERITLTAVVEPSDATKPRCTFVSMNGRVRIVSETYSETERRTFAVVEGILKGDVTVRVTSGDGVAQTDHSLTVLQSSMPDTPWSVDAGGGSFPNGASVISGTVGEGYLLPDWTVVDLPGMRLTGWVTADGTKGAMGQLSKASANWMAVYDDDDRRYSTDFLPHAAVRIYRTLDQYIDLTEMCVRGGEPVISMAENRPEQATLGAINAFNDPTKHLIGDRCTLWSSGDPGPIQPGMYIRIEDIQTDGTVLPVFDGFITTITPDAESGTIDIVAGDRKAFMAKSGTSIRRNFYTARSADTLVSAGFDGTVLYGDLTSLPPDAVLEPPYKWRVKTILPGASTDQMIVVKNPEKTEGTFFKATLPPFPFDTLGELTVKARCLHGGSAEYVSQGQVIVTTAKGSVPAAYRAPFNSQTGNFDIKVDFASETSPGIAVGGPVTIEVTTNLRNLRGFVSFYAVDDPDSTIRYCRVAGDIVTEARRPVLDLVGYNWKPCDASREGMKMKVGRIDDVGGDLSDPNLFEPSQGRMSVSYLSKDISTVQIMSGIAQASGLYPLPNSSAMGPERTTLKVYRAGGGYTQDYLQKLADISSPDGRMRSYRARGYTTPVVTIGTRHTVDDPSPMILAYGGDAVPGAMRFAGFSPRITLKNRPSLIMVRGSGTDFDQRTMPLMVAVENRDSRARRFGLSVEQVLSDSSVNSPLGAARAGYAAVNANDLDRWEGSMVLPGIVTSVMELSGPYVGSGVPVRITDSRNGLTDYHARVKEATLDYNSCTTTVTLVNHSIVYSSALGDTMSTASVAADVATGGGDSTLYETQYVRLVAAVPQDVDRTSLENRAVIIIGPPNAQTEVELTGIQFLDLPDNRTTMVAIGPKDGTVHTDGTRPYDVQAIKINNGVPITIPAPLRPDYYEGQTLIINLDFPTR